MTPTFEVKLPTIEDAETGYSLRFSKYGKNEKTSLVLDKQGKAELDLVLEEELLPFACTLIKEAKDMEEPEEGLFVGPDVLDRTIQHHLYDLQQALRAREVKSEQIRRAKN